MIKKLFYITATCALLGILWATFKLLFGITIIIIFGVFLYYSLKKDEKEEEESDYVDIEQLENLAEFLHGYGIELKHLRLKKGVINMKDITLSQPEKGILVVLISEGENGFSLCLSRDYSMAASFDLGWIQTFPHLHDENIEWEYVRYAMIIPCERVNDKDLQPTKFAPWGNKTYDFYKVDIPISPDKSRLMYWEAAEYAEG